MARKPKAQGVRRAIVTPDKHAPLHDRPSMEVVKQAIRLVKPDIYVDLGDVVELECLIGIDNTKSCRKIIPDAHILAEIDAEIEAANDLLDDIDAALNRAGCSERHFCIGNHDHRLSVLVEQNPRLSFYRPTDAFRLKERGYVVHELYEYLDLGKLSVYHGHHYAGQATHLRQHLINIGVSLMFGHQHSSGHQFIPGKDGPRGAWSIGHLKKDGYKAAKWMRGRPTNWAHGFAIVTLYPRGYFQVTQIDIINGMADVWGEVLDGNP